MQLCHINNGMLVLSYWLLSYVPKYLPGTLHANWHRICLALGSKLHGNCPTFSENINHTDLPQCRESRQLVHSPGRHMGKSWFSAKSVYIHCSSHYPGLSALERLTTYSRIILSYFPCPCQMHLVYMDWQSHLRLWMSLLAEEILKPREVSRKFLPGFVPSLSPSCNFTQCGLQYFRSNRSQYQSLLSQLGHARNTHSPIARKEPCATRSPSSGRVGSELKIVPRGSCAFYTNLEMAVCWFEYSRVPLRSAWIPLLMGGSSPAREVCFMTAKLCWLGSWP